MGFPGGSDGKASAYTAGVLGLIPGSGRAPVEGNGNPLQDSCLENSMDGGAWQATVHGVTNSRTPLSDFNVNVFKKKKSVCFVNKFSCMFLKNQIPHMSDISGGIIVFL